MKSHTKKQLSFYQSLKEVGKAPNVSSTVVPSEFPHGNKHPIWDEHLFTNKKHFTVYEEIRKIAKEE